MGVPAEAYQHDEVEDAEEFFAMLESADHRNFIMMAASHGEGENRNAEGIISGHAYSLISIHKVQSRGQEVRLLRLRNPWGSGEWEGDWSDDSPLWTEALKRQVNFRGADDGIFYIELQDYLLHFSWTSISVENNSARYFHSQLQHSFGSDADDVTMP